MEESFSPLPLSADSEPPLQFVFINEREEDDPSAKSNYGLKVRSHVGKRVYIERRRAFARMKTAAPVPKVNRQLLAKEASLERSPEPHTARALQSITSNERASNDAVDEGDIDEGQSAHTSESPDDLEEVVCSDHFASHGVQSKTLRKSPRRSSKLPAGKHSMQKTACLRDSTKTVAKVHASQIHQIRMYLKSRHISPTSILGEGKTDPFRSYPLDADTYEEGLLAYCKYPLFRTHIRS